MYNHFFGFIDAARCCCLWLLTPVRVARRLLDDVGRQGAWAEGTELVSIVEIHVEMRALDSEWPHEEGMRVMIFLEYDTSLCVFGPGREPRHLLLPYTDDVAFHPTNLEVGPGSPLSGTHLPLRTMLTSPVACMHKQ